MADIKAKGGSNGDGGRSRFSIALYTYSDDPETAVLQEAVDKIKSTEAYKTFMNGSRNNGSNFVRFLLAYSCDAVLLRDVTQDDWDAELERREEEEDLKQAEIAKKVQAELTKRSK